MTLVQLVVNVFLFESILFWSQLLIIKLSNQTNYERTKHIVRWSDCVACIGLFSTSSLFIDARIFRVGNMSAIVDMKNFLCREKGEETGDDGYDLHVGLTSTTYTPEHKQASALALKKWKLLLAAKKRKKK